jgi:CrcB protein
MKWLYLCLGGILGTVARYVLGGVVQRVAGAQFPWGTLCINLLGCFLIGIFAALSDKKFFFDSNMRIFLMIGFCGAFTTFSTFILETANLLKDSEFWPALINVMASVIAGFIVFRLGVVIGELI